eukprot:SAG31_NODE_2186_length_6239_cov_2.944951_3_plen_861_part_01
MLISARIERQRSDRLFKDARRKQEELRLRRIAAKQAASGEAVLHGNSILSKGTQKLLASGALGAHGYSPDGAVDSTWLAKAERQRDMVIAERKIALQWRPLKATNGSRDKEEASLNAPINAHQLVERHDSGYLPPGYFAPLSPEAKRHLPTASDVTGTFAQTMALQTRSSKLDSEAEKRLVGRLQDAVAAQRSRLDKARTAQEGAQTQAITRSLRSALSPSTRKAHRKLPPESLDERFNRLASPHPRFERSRSPTSAQKSLGTNSETTRVQRRTGTNRSISPERVVCTIGSSVRRQQIAGEVQRMQADEKDFHDAPSSSPMSASEELWEDASHSDDFSWSSDEDQNLTDAFAEFGLQRRRVGNTLVSRFQKRAKAGRLQTSSQIPKTRVAREATAHKAAITTAGKHDGFQIAWIGSLRVYEQSTDIKGGSPAKRQRRIRRRDRRRAHELVQRHGHESMSTARTVPHSHSQFGGAANSSVGSRCFSKVDETKLGEMERIATARGDLHVLDAIAAERSARDRQAVKARLEVAVAEHAELLAKGMLDVDTTEQLNRSLRVAAAAASPITNLNDCESLDSESEILPSDASSETNSFLEQEDMQLPNTLVSLSQNHGQCLILPENNQNQLQVGYKHHEQEAQHEEPKKHNEHGQSEVHDQETEIVHREVEPERQEIGSEHEEIEPERHKIEAEDREVKPERQEIGSEHEEIEPERHKIEAEDREVKPERQEIRSGHEDIEPEQREETNHRLTHDQFGKHDEGSEDNELDCDRYEEQNDGHKFDQNEQQHPGIANIIDGAVTGPQRTSPAVNATTAQKNQIQRRDRRRQASKLCAANTHPHMLVVWFSALKFQQLCSKGYLQVAPKL